MYTMECKGPSFCVTDLLSRSLCKLCQLLLPLCEDVLPDLCLAVDILQAGVDKGGRVLVRASSYWQGWVGGRGH